MIGRIKGELLEKQPPQLLIDVNGVGYEVEAPMTTFYQLPELGQAVTLHTHFVVREDAQLLYGFSTQRDRALFRSLIKVNGVGPKLALTILSGIETDQFVATVHNGDSGALVKLPGVGKKTAERLIVEMRDRLKDWDVPVSLENESDAKVVSIASVSHASVEQEAESALMALGYKPQEASRAIAAISEEGLSSEELIRRALKSMAS